jgi:uncharacterized protein
MAGNHGTFIWYELWCSDVARAKAFYAEVVGWSFEDPGEGYIHIQAPDGAFVGGMTPIRPEMAGAHPGWLAYIEVDDVDRTVADLEVAGGSVKMPPMDMENVGRFALVADPGGAMFYLMDPVPPPGAESAGGPVFAPEINCGHCGWNELMAADAARETAFYTGLFGWSLPEPMDMGELGKYQFIAHRDVTVGAIMGMMPGAPQPLWNHYFWVPGIAAAKETIEANGGQVINGPMEVPGGGWIVQGIDPQGAMFSLVGGK